MVNRKLIVTIAIVSASFIVALAYIQTLALANERSLSQATVLCTPQRFTGTLEAKSAYVFDISSNTLLYEKNAYQQMPLASLTKLMTVLVASRHIKSNDRIVITKEALSPEGDAGLFEGEVWHAQDLIDYTLITSANDGAHALALATPTSPETKNFTEAMNATAREIGLTQTYFLNDTGLDVSTSTGGAYGSAHDIAQLLNFIYHNASTVFDGSAQKKRVFTSVSGFTHDASHTSSVTGLLQGEALAKTGFTDLAGGNLGVIAEPILGHVVAIVVLQSSREGRDTDVAHLYEFARSAIKHSELCKQL